MNDFANWPHVMFRDWCSDMTLTIPQFFSPENYKDWLKLKHQELETRKYEAEMSCKKEEAGIKKAEVETTAQVKIAELQANTNAQKTLEDQACF